MIRSFGDTGTEDLFVGKASKKALGILPKALHPKAAFLLDLIGYAGAVEDLRIPPGNRLEKLKGELSGFYSIRINDQYRIIFQFRQGDAHRVQMVEYH